MYQLIGDFSQANPICVPENTANCWAFSQPQLAIMLDGVLLPNNHWKMQTELKQRSVSLQSHSTAELLLTLYRELGIDFLQKLDGAFAIAIWDARENKLILARDHIGQRSLFYRVHHETIHFANTIAPLLKVSETAQTLNHTAVRDYFFGQNIPQPQTVYREIHKLEAGKYLVFKNGRLTLKKWWNFDFDREDSQTTFPQWQKQLNDRLLDSFTSLHENEQKVGSFLSGGIDSSVVAGLLMENISSPIQTFSIGFEHREYNEATVAAKTAKRLGTNHSELIVSENILEILPQLLEAYQEPFADSSMIPVWYLTKLAAGKTDVIFCGDGGDELYAGYLRHRAIKLASRIDILPRFVRRLIGGPLQRMIPSPTTQKSGIRRVKRFLEALGMDPLERYSQWTTLFNRSRLRELFSHDFARELQNSHDPLTGFETAYRLAENRDLVTKMSVVDLLCGIADNAMVKVGTAAAAQGIECRYPFLSRQLIELAFQMPIEHKMHGNKGKYIVRETYRRFLPPELDQRPKMGFGAPLDHWFRGGPLSDYAGEVLTDPQTTNRGFFNQPYVERLLREHRSGAFDHAYRLWSLLFFELWYRRWMQ